MDNQKVRWDGHYIQDKTLFSAACFAKQMHEVEGRPLSEAVGIASGHYKVPFTQVAVELMVDAYIKRDALKEA